MTGDDIARELAFLEPLVRISDMEGTRQICGLCDDVAPAGSRVTHRSNCLWLRAKQWDVREARLNRAR